MPCHRGSTSARGSWAPTKKFGGFAARRTRALHVSSPISNPAHLIISPTPTAGTGRGRPLISAGILVSFPLPTLPLYQRRRSPAPPAAKPRNGIRGGHRKHPLAGGAESVGALVPGGGSCHLYLSGWVVESRRRPRWNPPACSASASASARAAGASFFSAAASSGHAQFFACDRDSQLPFACICALLVSFLVPFLYFYLGVVNVGSSEDFERP